MATAASRLLSFWVKAAVVAVLAAAAVIVAFRSTGSDGEESERRAAVRSYIVAVNTTYQTYALDLHEMNETYRTLSFSGRRLRVQATRVENAKSALRRLRSRLASIPAPPEARRLRTEVVELADLYLALAAEVATMTRYVAIQSEEGRSLVAATNRLERELGRATTAEEQRAVLYAYRAELVRLATRLDRADAPEVLEPGRVRQMTRMRRLATLSGQLGQALGEDDSARANRIFRQFVQQTTAVRTTKADQAAVRAYNARLGAITKQRSVIAAERARLSAST